jgi:hypothetical protein
MSLQSRSTYCVATRQPGAAVVTVQELAFQALWVEELWVEELGVEELGVEELGVEELGVEELGVEELAVEELAVEEVGPGVPSTAPVCCNAETSTLTFQVAAKRAASRTKRR